MAEIKEDGYVALRTLIVREWNKFALLDEDEEEVYTTTLDEDNWIHDRDEEEVFLGEDGRGAPIYDDLEFESNDELEFEVKITGDDVGDLPVTVDSSTLSENYSINEREDDDDKSRTVSVESFDSFTFENENDELTVKHKIKIPSGD